jgi:hypothetical protein
VFVLILVEQTEFPERSLMLTVVTWTVALSVYAHGLTVRPGADAYGDWYAALAKDHAAMPESGPVVEQRIRAPALRRQRHDPDAPRGLIGAEIHPMRVKPGRRWLGDHWWQRPCAHQGPGFARTRQARTPMTTNREGSDDAGDQATTPSALRRPT